MRLMALQSPILPAAQLRRHGNFRERRGVCAGEHECEDKGMSSEAANTLCDPHGCTPENRFLSDVGECRRVQRWRRSLAIRDPPCNHTRKDAIARVQDPARQHSHPSQVPPLA